MNELQPDSSSCSWTGWKNGYDDPVDYKVPPGYVLSGMYSIHSNKQE